MGLGTATLFPFVAVYVFAGNSRFFFIGANVCVVKVEVNLYQILGSTSSINVMANNQLTANYLQTHVWILVYNSETIKGSSLCG